MKKLAIAASSVALAAMPVVGVFAVAGDGTVVDNLSVTVQPSCSISGDGTESGTAPALTYTKSVNFGNITNGTSDTADGSTMTVFCNDGSGWYVNAVGGNVTGTGQTAVSNLNGALNTSTPIAAGTATTGTASSWAMKITKISGDVESDMTTFAAAPTSATKVAHSAKETSTTTSDQIKAEYQVYIGTAQEADTYTGSVTYTLVHPNSN